MVRRGKAESFGKAVGAQNNMKRRKLLLVLAGGIVVAIVAAIATHDRPLAGWRWVWAWPNHWRMDSGTVSVDGMNGVRQTVGVFYRCGPIFVEHRYSSS